MTPRPSTASNLLRTFCSCSASQTPRPRLPPPPPSAAAGATPSSSSNAPPPRTRLSELSDLPPIRSTLTFRSLPYASPTAHLFPPASTPNFVTHNNLFTLRCYPSPSRSTALTKRRSALLDSPSPPPSLLRPEKRYELELTVLCGKKKVHKSAVIRERCKRRFREGVRVVLARGAEGKKDGTVVVRGESKKGVRGGVVPGYMYVASLSLEMYRAPFSEIVETLRKSLKMLQTKAENGIITKQLDDLEMPPQRHSEERLSDVSRRNSEEED